MEYNWMPSLTHLVREEQKVQIAYTHVTRNSPDESNQGHQSFL